MLSRFHSRQHSVNLNQPLRFVVPVENNRAQYGARKPSRTLDNMILIRDQVYEEQVPEVKKDKDIQRHSTEEKKQSCKQLKDIQELMTTVNHVKKLSV